MDDEALTKVYIDLPEDGGPSSESFWARPLGDDLYELRNSPWYAYDLHFYDVVRALADAPDDKPRIREVIKRSGHRTLRVIFSDGTDPDTQSALLRQLNDRKAYYEKAWERFYAVDVEPDGDYQAVCNQLWAWEQEGILAYETGMMKDVF